MSLVRIKIAGQTIKDLVRSILSFALKIWHAYPISRVLRYSKPSPPSPQTTT